MRHFFLFLLKILNIAFTKLIFAQGFLSRSIHSHIQKIDIEIKREFKTKCISNFVELFQKDEKKKIFKEELLKNINFCPVWVPCSKRIKYHFSFNYSSDFLHCFYDNGYYRFNLTSKANRSFKLIWDYYGINFNSLIDKDYSCRNILNRYKIGWFRYLSDLRTDKIKAFIMSFIGDKTEEHQINVRKEKVIIINDFRRWDTVFINNTVNDLIIKIPISRNNETNDGSNYFIRILALDSDLGLISRILPIQIENNYMQSRISLRNMDIIVEKLFSINSKGTSKIFYKNFFPLIVSYGDKSISRTKIRKIIIISKKRNILNMKKLPKAIVANMGGHTHPVFAIMVGNLVYPTDNGAKVTDYFSPSSATFVVRNLETAVTQGAAIIQIGNSDYHGQLKNDEEICNAFVRAARLCLESGAGAIEINLCGFIGLPYDQVGFMENPNLCGKIVKRILKKINKKIPILVKIRLGLNSNHLNAVEVARSVANAGASAITVLAQSQDMKCEPLYDYSLVKEVKNAVRIPVIANGGICSPQNAKEILELTRADAVMIGCATIGDPGLIKRVINYLENGQLLTPPSPLDSLYLAKKYLEGLCKYYGRDFDFNVYMKDFLCGYMHYIIADMTLENKIYFIESFLNVNNVNRLIELFDAIEMIIKKLPN